MQHILKKIPPFWSIESLLEIPGNVEKKIALSYEDETDILRQLETSDAI